MKTKFICFILVGVLAGAMLTGCANDKQPSTQPTESVTESTTESASQETEDVSEEASSTESNTPESETQEPNKEESTKQEPVEEVVASGKLSDAKIEWEIIENTLYVRGEGEIPGYEFCAAQSRTFPDSFPWEDLKDWQPYDTLVEKIVIEEGITKIGKFNFTYFTNTKEIIFADSVVEVGNYGCNGLGIENLDFNNITKLGTQAFGELNNLKSLIIPGSVKHLGFGAFAYCSSPYIKDIYVEEGVEVIEGGAFRYFPAGCSLHLPASVTSLDINAMSRDMIVYVKSGSYVETILNEDGRLIEGLIVIVE